MRNFAKYLNMHIHITHTEANSLDSSWINTHLNWIMMSILLSDIPLINNRLITQRQHIKKSVFYVADVVKTE